MQSMYINGHAVAHTSKYNIIKLNSLTCVQEALFPAWFWISFFPFFLYFPTRWELHTDFRSSHFQIRNQTEGLDAEHWGSEVSAPTHLKMPNKGPNRNLLTSCLTLYTITRNSVIPAANHSSDLLHMCTGICNTIGHLCFQFPGTLGHSTGLYWETQEVREYLTSGWSTVWVHPNRISPDQELIRSAWPSFLSQGIALTNISLTRSPWPSFP